MAHAVERRLSDLGYAPERVDRMLSEAWLGLGDTTNLVVKNPFDSRSPEEIERPHRFVLSLMSKPDYFGLTCKHLLNMECLPYQLAVLGQLWTHAFPIFIGSRGAAKSALNAAYALLRAIICQGSKIIIVGAGFRQAKVVFDYMAGIWSNAPLLRDICSDSRENGPRSNIDRCTFRVGESLVIALPIGDGSKIRGQRASIIIADEFASQNEEIFDLVVSGFAAVSLNPVEKAKATAKRRLAGTLGLPVPDEDIPPVAGLRSNQTILSGTAYYGFNHFCAAWKKHVRIIESRGDPRVLEEIFNGDIPARFDYRDYCVIRLPVESLPKDYMDEVQVAKQKATLSRSRFQMEYGAVFQEDSEGFFKRSLIESCVVGKPASPLILPSGEVRFGASLRGDPKGRYVIGVDPASEVDNFAIVVLELREDHRRVVHCWTTDNKRHKERVKSGLVKENNFYGYVARRIRDLMKLFPCERVAMDSQGGGGAVLEALMDPASLQKGETPIYAVPDPAKPRDSDKKPGLHVVEMVVFARAEWVAEANHGLKFDMESKALLFPSFDSVAVGLALEQDRLMERAANPGRSKQAKGNAKRSGSLYDTLEDCMAEIEDLKDELASIIHMKSGPASRDRWDVPDGRGPDGKRVRVHKDRYSALLMANMAARVMGRVAEMVPYESTGGFAHEIVKRKEAEGWNPQTRNPDWYERMGGGTLGAVAKRR